MKQQKSFLDFKIDYSPQSTHDFFIFPKELSKNLKETNAASPQPAKQNLLHIENIFKDTVDLKRMSYEFAWLALLAYVTWKVLCKRQRRWTKIELNCPKPATKNSQDVKEQTPGRLNLSLFKTNPDLWMLRARLFITMRILIFHQHIV